MFIVTKEIFNVDGDYEGEWVSDGSDPLHIDEPENAVKMFVDSHNTVFINTAERELNERITSMQVEIDTAQFKLDAARALSAEQQIALGISISELESAHRMKVDSKRQLEQDLKLVQTDPFKRVSRWKVPVKRRMVMEEVIVYKLKLNANGQLDPVEVDAE